MAQQAAGKGRQAVVTNARTVMCTDNLPTFSHKPPRRRRKMLRATSKLMPSPVTIMAQQATRIHQA